MALALLGGCLSEVGPEDEGLDDLARQEASGDPDTGLRLKGASILYYSVYGTTKQQLSEYLKNTRIQAKDRNFYSGNFDGGVEWWVWPDGKCWWTSLSKWAVVRLPRWENEASAMDDGTGWKRQYLAFRSALAKHEEGHMDRVLEAYRVVSSAWSGASCANKSAAAQAAYDSFDLDEAQDDYEALTDHCRTDPDCHFP